MELGSLYGYSLSNSGPHACVVEAFLGELVHQMHSLQTINSYTRVSQLSTSQGHACPRKKEIQYFPQVAGFKLLALMVSMNNTLAKQFRGVECVLLIIPNSYNSLFKKN